MHAGMTLNSPPAFLHFFFKISSNVIPYGSQCLILYYANEAIHSKRNTRQGFDDNMVSHEGHCFLQQKVAFLV